MHCCFIICQILPILANFCHWKKGPPQDTSTPPSSSPHFRVTDQRCAFDSLSSDAVTVQTTLWTHIRDFVQSVRLQTQQSRCSMRGRCGYVRPGPAKVLQHWTDNLCVAVSLSTSTGSEVSHHQYHHHEQHQGPCSTWSWLPLCRPASATEAVRSEED